MDTGELTTRRRFLRLTGGVAAGIVLPAIPSAVLAAQQQGEEANPVEDLMREHGVLRRMLLIYDEAATRIRDHKELPPGIIADSANIVLRYVHDYHEKLEEEDIFPTFTKAGKLSDLVGVLTAQHVAGRRLTDSILQMTRITTVKPAEAKTEEKKEKAPAAVEQIYGGTPLITRLLGKETKEMKMTDIGIPHSKQALFVAIEQFARLYRPHAAREDTVLFTAFHSLVSPLEFTRLGERLQNRGRQILGENGFEKTLESVVEIEKKLGIYDLSQFTTQA